MRLVKERRKSKRSMKYGARGRASVCEYFGEFLRSKKTYNGGRYIVRKTILKVLLSYFILYVLQFLIIPLFYDEIIGGGNEATAVLCITTVIITLIGMIAFSDKLRFWLLGLLFYTALIFLYTPEGAYGIGMWGIDLDGTHSHYEPSARYIVITVVVILVLLIQLSVWCFVKLLKLIKFIIRKLKK